MRWTSWLAKKNHFFVFFYFCSPSSATISDKTRTKAGGSNKMWNIDDVLHLIWIFKVITYAMLFFWLILIIRLLDHLISNIEEIKRLLLKFLELLFLCIVYAWIIAHFAYIAYNCDTDSIDVRLLLCPWAICAYRSNGIVFDRHFCYS